MREKTPYLLLLLPAGLSGFTIETRGQPAYAASAFFTISLTMRPSARRLKRRTVALEAHVMGIFRPSKRGKCVLLHTPLSEEFGYKMIGGSVGKNRRKGTCGG
jgi:hypothetical protein